MGVFKNIRSQTAKTLLPLLQVSLSILFITAIFVSNTSAQLSGEYGWYGLAFPIYIFEAVALIRIIFGPQRFDIFSDLGLVIIAWHMQSANIQNTGYTSHRGTDLPFILLISSLVISIVLYSICRYAEFQASRKKLS